MKWFSGWRTGRDTPRTYPIAILSFDRPDYLRPVLKSLAAQTSTKDRVILFQDGVWNRFSQRSKADQRNIDRCIALFLKFFPGGEVHRSPENLGIAWNYERAEKHMFEMMAADSCLFLEDDLVLTPNYLDAIDQLLEMARSNERIGYVSAYGDMWASPAQQRDNAAGLIPMHENWGAALTRRSWLAERPFRLDYLELVRDIDYSLRNHDRIRRFYAARGWQTRITSQDSARWIACLERSAVRLTTRACHAKYIGERGEHFTPEIFKTSGFARTRVYKGEMARLNPPSDLDIAQWLETETARFKGNGNSFYPGHSTTSPA